MTEERRRVLQYLIDCIDQGAADHMLTCSPEEIDETFLRLWDASKAIDAQHRGAVPARYMPVFEAAE